VDQSFVPVPAVDQQGRHLEMAAGYLVDRASLGGAQNGSVVADGAGRTARVQTEGPPRHEHVRLVVGDLIGRLG
jgi:hypothetical protein